MTKDELKQRTKQFGLRVMKLIDALPKSMSGRAVGNQLVRSGTAVGANYRAACRARSAAEFLSRIGVVEEEADELTRIFAATIRTMKRTRKKAARQQTAGS